MLVRAGRTSRQRDKLRRRFLRRNRGALDRARVACQFVDAASFTRLWFTRIELFREAPAASDTLLLRDIDIVPFFLIFSDLFLIRRRAFFCMCPEMVFPRIQNIPGLPIIWLWRTLGFLCFGVCCAGGNGRTFVLWTADHQQ